MATVNGVTAEHIDELMESKLDFDGLVAGAGVTLTPNETTKKVTIAASGGGGGLIYGARRLMATNFTLSEITSGGGNYTQTEANDWTDLGAILTGPDYDANSPAVVIAPDGSAFDTVDAGIFGLRFSISISYIDDADTPPWFSWQANTYWNNRPHSGMVHTCTAAEAGGRFLGTGPGGFADVVLQPFENAGFDPLDGSYYLSCEVKWPGHGYAIDNMSIFADLIRLA